MGLWVRVLVWWRRKVEQWRNDARQLGLWLALAFKRNRSGLDTATMTHQMRFLQGRVMSPMNLFGIAALFILMSLGGFGLQEWRIDRVKRERDAPCNDIELSQDDDGDYRTTRAACAALGETANVARGWRDYAIETERELLGRIATVQSEYEADLARVRRDQERSARARRNERRRANEAIAVAGGGAAPDLERSLCELTGSVDCDGAAGAPGSGAATESPGVPDRNAGPGDAGPADASGAQPAS